VSNPRSRSSPIDCNTTATSVAWRYQIVTAYQSYLLGTGQPGSLTAPAPLTPSELLALGGVLKANVGHTGWTEGQTFQTGMTFVFAPNTPVPYTAASTTQDLDYISSRDGSSATEFSHAVVTARSYHAGGIANVLFADGSARAMSPEISIDVWRAWERLAEAALALRHNSASESVRHVRRKAVH
jgi:prepilin-type processing-associated H-X9-DG protein